MRRNRSPMRDAFTLVEAITAITIVSVIGVLTTFVLAEAIDNYADSSTRSTLHLELSVALDQAARELRSIPLDTTGPTSVPDISSISSTSLSFGSTGSLALIGTDLVLARPGESAATVLTGVVDFSLDAYDESNAQLSLPLGGTACDAVRRLSLTITAERGGLTETLRSRVFLRSTILAGGS